MITDVGAEQYSSRSADMAQMVAHLIGNEEVTGSIPVVSSHLLVKCNNFIHSLLTWHRW